MSIIHKIEADYITRFQEAFIYRFISKDCLDFNAGWLMSSLIYSTLQNDLYVFRFRALEQQNLSTFESFRDHCVCDILYNFFWNRLKRTNGVEIGEEDFFRSIISIANEIRYSIKYFSTLAAS